MLFLSCGYYVCSQFTKLPFCLCKNLLKDCLKIFGVARYSDSLFPCVHDPRIYTYQSYNVQTHLLDNVIYAAET
jgi:hypothetical protein